MAIKCILLDHAGDETESGYHVCSHCGMHAYWDSSTIRNENNDRSSGLTYGQAGLLTRPITWVAEFACTIKSSFIDWWCYSVKKELPF